MIIDIIYFVVLLIFVIRGYSKGFVVSLFAVIAIILGVWGALKLSGTVALLLFKDSSTVGRWAPLISYIIVFFLIVWLVRLGAMLIHKSFQLLAIGPLNRLAGAILYGFLVSFVASSLLWIFHKMDLIKIEIEQASFVYSFIAPLAPLVFNTIGYILPFVRNTFDDLSLFFDTVKHSISGHVGND